MSKAVTVGYRYFMGLHFGLCYGPVDALLEIKAGDRTAWSGSQTTSGAINVAAFDLFGGEEREGGIAGTLDVMMGESTQAANAYLASKQSGPQPGYRGVLTAVFRGISAPFYNASQLYLLRHVAQPGGYIGAMNPYIKPWAFRIRRIAQGWRTAVFNPTKAAVTIGSVQAMNPAHIIYQCFTDPEWGMGYPTSTIGASFTTASDQLHAEGFGLCMQWARQDTIENFMQIVANHCGAVISTNRRTGQFEMRLIRGGYTVSALPLFDESNIIALESFQRGSPAESTNEVTVKYRNPATGKDESVTVHNLANITAQGGIVSTTSSYPGLPSRDLASRVAARDLLAASSNLAKIRFRANRAAHELLPGDVIRVRWTRLGLVDLVIRVGRVDYGSLTDGAITVEGVEDVFSLPSASYVGTPPNGWTAPVVIPQPLPAQLLMEAPYRTIYRLLSEADRAVLTDDDCYAMGLGPKPANMVGVGFDFQTRTGSNAYTTRERGVFTPYGTASATVTHGATSVTLNNAGDLSLLEIGTAAMLGSEIVRVTAVDLTTSTVTIARGCGDTVPQQHAVGTAFFGLDDFEANDPTQYANGETVNGRFLTVATGGILAEGSAAVSNLTMARRRARPYPPADLQMNAARYPTSISGALTITWAHRDRLLQADQLIDTAAANVGPEAGTTYTLTLYGNDGTTIRRTVTGLAGTTYTWTSEGGDSALLGTERTPTAIAQSSTAAGTSAGSTTNMRDTTADTGTGTNASALEWIRADLGSSQAVGAVEVSGGTLAGFGAVAASLNGRVIQHSDDLVTWTTVATISGVDNSGQRFTFTFTAATARYWRIATTGGGSQAAATCTFALYGGGASLNTSVRVRLKAVRGGLDSHQEHDYTVARV